MSLKDTFEIRAMTVVQSSPEEIAQVLVDQSKRMQWDIYCMQVSKSCQGDNLKITYERSIFGKRTESNVQLKYSFAETFMNGHTTYLIHEKDEGGADSYYELAPIVNRPNAIKVTYFTTLTPENYQARGKQVWL